MSRAIRESVREEAVCMRALERKQMHVREEVNKHAIKGTRNHARVEELGKEDTIEVLEKLALAALLEYPRDSIKGEVQTKIQGVLTVEQHLHHNQE